jgi:hypothetical protein
MIGRLKEKSAPKLRRFRYARLLRMFLVGQPFTSKRSDTQQTET